MLDAVLVAHTVERVARRASCAPGMVSQRVAGAARAVGARPEAVPDAGWWMEGSPRVPAGVLATTRLPDRAAFTAMLQAEGVRP